MRLPPDLYRLCRSTLLKCSEFDSDLGLRSIFVATEMAPFSSSLPEAANRSARVDTTIAYLLPNRLSDGRSAFLLFITVLRDRYESGDALHDKLHKLVETVRLADSESLVEPAMAPLSPGGAGTNPSDERPQFDLQRGKPHLEPSLRRYLNERFLELQHRYATLTKRKAALDIDIARAAGELQKQILNEQLSELEAERASVVKQLVEVETQLSGTA